jgi:hypothetical protein
MSRLSLEGYLTRNSLEKNRIKLVRIRARRNALFFVCREIIKAKEIFMERDFLGVWIPKEIYLHKDLTPTEKLLLAEISSFATNGICFASNQHFSDFLGISKSQVSRLISKLSKMNLISVELIYKLGSKEVDKRIITPISMNADTPTHECVYPLSVDAYTPTHECVDPMRIDAYYKEQYKIQSKEQVKDKNKKTNKKAKQPNEDFEALWKMYPRKQGSKKKAQESYEKAVKNGSATYEQVKNGIEMYIKYNKYHNVSEEYIKHGSTWFNQECWNNDYTCRPKVIQGKRKGFSGMILNDMEQQLGNIIDYEGEIINEQARYKDTDGFDTIPLSVRLEGF